MMRPIRAAATGLLVASLAVAACSRSQPDQSNPPAARPAATSTPAAATTATSGSGESQSTVLADGRHPVLIKTVDPDRHTITFDLIQFYQGEDAIREAAKDHQESPPPNDYYIRNVNPRLRTLPVARDAVITTNTLTAGYTGSATKNVRLPLDRLRIVLLGRSSPPFWITVRYGQVVKIAEQFVP